MIVSFALGVFRIRWEWLLLVCAAGVAFDWLQWSQAAPWRERAGLEAGEWSFLDAIALVIIFNVPAYWLGMGARWCYERLRRRAS